MKAVIFANADIYDYSFCEKYLENTDIIISCDGGMRHTKKLGIVPNYILGDFDSAEPDVIKYYKDMEIEFRQFPEKKDETDMELSLGLAIDINADDIVIMGGIGSRLDHTLANVHLLYTALKKGVRARLVNENNCAELIDSSIEIDGEKGDIVSILPISMTVKGITHIGMEYPLNNAELSIDSPRGISNVMLGDKAYTTISEGLLLVIKSRD